MSRGKKLGILSGILLVVILALVLITQLTGQGENEEEGTEILTIPVEKITSVAWEYEGEDLHFVKHGDTWVCPEQERFPVDSALLETMISQLESIRAYKEITGNDHLSDYGLDPAVLTLTVSADRDYTIRFGNENDLDGQVYALWDDTVFLTDSMLRAQFSKRALELVQQEVIPALDTIQSVEIRREGELLNLEYDDSGERTYSKDYVWLGSYGGNTVPLDSEETETFLSNVKTLQWTGTAAYPADSGELSEYGLQEPSAQINVRYRDEDGKTDDFSILIGSETDSGECYVMIPGSDRIYRTGASLREAAISTTVEDLMPRKILSVDWDSVKTMVVSLDGKEFSLSRNEGGDKIEDAQKGKQIWKTDDKKGTADLTEALNALAAVQGEVRMAEASRQVLFSLTMERNTANYPQLILVIGEGEDGECIVSINDTQFWTVDRETADAVIEQFRKSLTQ